MNLPQDEQDVLLLHNPRCSKSRAARALLEERGIAFRERLYLEDPLSEAELEEVGKRLGVPAIEWTRTKEAAWAEAGLSAESEDSAIRRAVAAHPSLMERPVVLRGRRAVVGRPTERVADLFVD